MHDVAPRSSNIQPAKRRRQQSRNALAGTVGPNARYFALPSRPRGGLVFDCAREEFVALARSRVWQPVDDQPVWSISCFFVAKEFRGQGLSVELIKSAVAFARQQGAKIVEGYPQELTGSKLPAPFVWTGLASAYRQAGFTEVLRRSKNKPIMRVAVGHSQ